MADVKNNPPMTGVVADLRSRDATAAIDFYKRAFGAEEVTRMMSDDGKLVMHCELTVNGGRLMLGDAFPDYGYPWEEPKGVTLTLPVVEPHDLWKRAIEAGCEVVMPLEIAFWGDWYGQVKDPFGHVWAFVAPAEKKQE